MERTTTASVFHHPAWLGLLERRYRYSFTAPCVADEKGTLMAGLPVARVESRITGRRLVALPFSDLCPPLLAEPGERGEAGLAAALSRLRSASDLDLEIRAPLPGIAGGQVVARFAHHVLDLEGGAEHIERRVVRSQIRRGIAKARREGVTIELSTAPAALDAFYRLHLRTRRRQGIPTQPKRFVDGFAELFDRNLGFTLLARHGGRPIAAAVFLYLHGTLTYKYGASDERQLGLRPNNLLFAESIRWASERGLRRLDLGRTDLDNAGLRSFKGAWGAQERPLAYTYLAESLPREGRGPARRALAAVIRHSPPIASRAVGAALYRHAG